MPTTEELDDYLSLAAQLAIDASDLLKRMQGTQTTAVQKDEVDIATSADLAAEKLIINGIKEKYPSHSIYSEEAGKSNESSEYQWIIDPLDGTKEYVRGSDDFNVLIALEYQRKLIVGAYSRVINSNLFTTSFQGGSFKNGKKIEVSKASELHSSVIGFRLPNRSSGQDVIKIRVNTLEKLINNLYRVRCPSDDAHAFAMVACGQLEAHVLYDGVCDWYDVAPTLLLVKEAGGMVTDFFGNEVKSADFSHGILASNGHIHSQMLELIAPQV